MSGTGALEAMPSKNTMKTPLLPRYPVVTRFASFTEQLIRALVVAGLGAGSTVAVAECDGTAPTTLIAFAQTLVDRNTEQGLPELSKEGIADIHSRMQRWIAVLPRLDEEPVLRKALTFYIPDTSLSAARSDRSPKPVPAGQSATPTELDYAVQVSQLERYAEWMARLLAPETSRELAPCRPREYVMAFIAAEATLHRLRKSSSRLVRMVQIAEPLLSGRTVSPNAIDAWAAFWLHFAQATAATFAHWPTEPSAPEALREALLGIWGRVILPVEPRAITLDTILSGPGRMRARSTDCGKMEVSDDMVEAYPKLLTLLYKFVVDWAINERQLPLPDSLGSLITQISERPYCKLLVSPASVNKYVESLRDERTETGNLSFSVRRLSVLNLFEAAQAEMDRAATAAQPRANTAGLVKSGIGATGQAQPVEGAIAPIKPETLSTMVRGAGNSYEIALKQHSALVRLQRSVKGEGTRCVDRLDYETRLFALAKNVRPSTEDWHRLENPNTSGFVNMRGMYPELIQRCIVTYQSLMAEDSEGKGAAKPGFTQWPQERDRLLASLYAGLLSYALSVDDYLARTHPEDLEADAKTRLRFVLLQTLAQFSSKRLQKNFDSVISNERENLVLAELYERLARLSLEADSRNTHTSFREDYYRQGLAALIYNPFNFALVRAYLAQANKDGNVQAERSVLTLYSELSQRWVTSDMQSDSAVTGFGSALQRINAMLPTLGALRLCGTSSAAPRIDVKYPSCAQGGKELLSVTTLASEVDSQRLSTVRTRALLGAFLRISAQSREQLFLSGSIAKPGQEMN
jgi:hypothetical protein